LPAGAVGNPAEAGELKEFEMTTMERDMGRSQASAGLSALATALMWPIISLLVTGGWHLAIEAIWPDLRTTFVPPVLLPVLLAYGAWAGYRSVAASSSYVVAIVAGVILGLLPFTLQLVGFGLMLGRGFDAGLLGGIFGFTAVLWGALLGGGYAISARARP
jgi:hypothetical protein